VAAVVMVVVLVAIGNMAALKRRHCD